MRHTRRTFSALLLAHLALPCIAGAGSFTEDFTTTTYRDPVATTANWDTTDEELRLFPFSLSLTGSADTPGVANDQFVSGDHAYIADGTSGLQVIDISDPAAPVLVGSFDTPGDAAGIYVDGDQAFVADGLSGLQVIDVSDPTSPASLGSANTPGFAYSVFVSGDHAYVADNTGGLQVVDVSDPASPAIVGSVVPFGEARKVFVDGDHAFLAYDAVGLRVIDVSEPTAPALAGIVDTPGQAHSVVVDGDHAFVADGGSGLQVIDVSDPTAPAIVGTVDTPGVAEGVSVSGNRLYLADRAEGVVMIDVTDPTAPVILQTIATPGFAREVMADGEHAYVAQNTSGLEVIQVAARVGSPALAGSVATSSCHAVAVSGDHAIVRDQGANGLHVIDISDPATPTLVGFYAGGLSDGGGVAVSGDYVFTADYGAVGLHVVDISDPTSPTLAGSYGGLFEGSSVTVSGAHAFVADGSAGIKVIDISDPTSPTLVGSHDTPGYASKVAVAGDFALVADNSSGLRVLDISDPTNPSPAGSYSTPSPTYGVAVSGDLAVVAIGNAGLQVIDISDPTNPSFVGSYNTPHFAYGVSLAGNLALVADGGSGLQVMDITDPANPSLVGSYDTPGQSRDVAIAGDHAFVSDGSSLQVIAVLQTEVDPVRNVGQSLAVDGGTEIIPRARVTSTETAGISWELSADAGANWQTLDADGSWAGLTPGEDLLWRTTHAWASPGVNPAVSDLTIDWLNEFAPIMSITDIPDDQGGRVSLTFDRSGYDFLDETVHPIVGYAIYRRVDDPPLARQALESGVVPEAEPVDGPPLAAYGLEHIRVIGDRVFVEGDRARRGSGFPPGVWEGVGWVLPTQSDAYVANVHTLSDSTASGTAWSVYFTATHTSTPSIWFASAPDSGYSVDNIPPSVPTGLARMGDDLSWDPAPEPDFEYHTVYGSDVAELDPTATLIGYTVDSTYDVSSSPFAYYHVTTSDRAGNESDAASIEGPLVSVTPGDVPPSAFALQPAHPNPMRSGTTLRFDLPEPGYAALQIVDVAGRRVRTLSAGHHPAGRYTLSWDGRDDRNAPVVSGVYFARLEAPSSKAVQRLLVIR